MSLLDKQEVQDICGHTGVDLYVNEHQTIRHFRARSTEERRSRRKKNAKSRFFISRGAYVNLHYIAMLYTHSIGNQP